MPRIRLLTSVIGERGEVRGDPGEILEVDAATAKQWADGERAERVIDRDVPNETAVRRNRPRDQRREW